MPIGSDFGVRRGPIVAILDDDVAPGPIADVAWSNRGEVHNGLDDDYNGVVDDVNGAVFTRAIVGREWALGSVATSPGSYARHGSGVASIAADHLRSTSGRILGVGITVTEEPLRGFERAVDYLVSLRARGEPVCVANASFGVAERDPASRARWLAAAQKLEAAGIVLVCAVRNSPQGPHVDDVPSGLGLSNIVTVGFLDLAGRPFAPADIYAPGIEVPATSPHGLRARMTGSSAAAPQVSAAIASWFERYPGASAGQAREALLVSARGGMLDVAALMVTPPR